MLSRRRFCLTASAAAIESARAAGKSLLLIRADQAPRMKAQLSSSAGIIQELAEAALKTGPWSVTTTRPRDVDAKPNDYYSEGPYWWPDPKNPGGPYIRKDGERNPARFVANRNDLGAMCSATLALGMGAYLSKDKRCGDHGSRILSTWFVDPKTRMNPNLEYGQAVRGHNTGRGIGVIDTVSLIHCAQGILLLELTGYDAGPVRRWFADYLKWMTTSKKGLDEKKAENNHGTWWTAQAAAFATLTGDEANLQMAWKQYRDVLVPTQIEADGSCPREEERTNSLSYSAMNLDGFAVICRIAQTHGVDLWNYQGPKGSVKTAFRYLLPYVKMPDTWRKQQISKWSGDATVFPLLSGLYRGLTRAKTPWVQWAELAASA